MGNILVTGCNGFIGSKLTSVLLNNGYKVIGLSTAKNPIIVHNNFKYISIDLTDSISVEKVFSEYDIYLVIHLAAIAHLKNRKRIDWNEYYRINTLVSKTIFQCAINSGSKIFYASTVDVYGSMNVPVITENCKPKPISDYGRSKYIAEKLLIEMVSNHTTNYIIGRLAPVYDKDIMKDVYKRIYLKYPNLAYKVSGENDFHFVSVNNVIDFILKWMESNENMNGVYNICDGTTINSEAFIELEKQKGNAQTVICIPRKLIITMKFILDYSYKMVNNNKIKKISENLSKLIHPPKYCKEKMKKIKNPKWDLKNTVYEK